MTEVSAQSITVAFKPSQSSHNNVKLKFFETIGLDTLMRQQSKDTFMMTSGVDGTNEWSNIRTQKVSTFHENLKYDVRADKRYAPGGSQRNHTVSQETNSGDECRKRKKSLTFNEQVEVVPIPMRTEYSNRVKFRLWSNAIEIQENAARNALEFASEGYVKSVSDPGPMSRTSLLSI
jgi:hypothetical protein